MPVSGEPTPFYQTLLAHRSGETVRQAVASLAHLFPRPHNFVTAIGFNLRKQRLGVELAEFDLLHRLRRGRPAAIETLCDVGKAIIPPDAERFPTDPLPVDAPLLVTSKSYYSLIRVSDAADANRLRDRARQRRARSLAKRKQGDNP